MRGLQMQRAILLENIKSEQKLLEIVQARFDRGITNELDVTLARRQLATLQSKIAPLAVYLASDAAMDVNGQIFAVRNNELFVMSQPRPVRSVHRGEGWTPESIAEHAMPALRSSFHSLDVSADVFSWDPV